MSGNGPDTFTRLDAKRREQTPQALARLVISSLFVGLWAMFWVARVPMPLPFLIALLLEIAFFVVYWRLVFILPNVRAVSLAQYGMLAAEIVFHTSMVYFLGGLSWLGSFAYVFGLIFTNAFLDLRKGLIYTTGACAAFAAMVLLDATGTIPHYEYLPQDSLRYTDAQFVGTTLVGAIGVFFSIYVWSSWVGHELRRERDTAVRAQGELLDARVDLQRANEELEQRVRARTVELEMANAALRDSEARVRTVITNAPIVLFALNNDGAFMLLEGQPLEAMNVDPDQIVGRSAFEVYANAPNVIAAIHKALAGERATTLAPGGAFLFEAQLGPMLDDRGNVTGAIGVATDITERKRAEDALRESEERLRSVVSNVSVVLFAVDKSGKFTLSEGRGLNVLGLKPGEVVGQSAFDIYADVPEIVDNIQRCLAGDEFVHTVDVGGLLFETHHSPMRDALGNVIGMIGVATDVTDSKRAEDALRESEAVLRSTIESTADGILVVNTDGAVVYANQRFAEMWRIPQSLIVRRDDDELLDFVLNQLLEPDAFLAKVKELYQSAEEDLDTLEFKDGRAFERYSRPLMLDDQVSGRVWSFRDITERKRVERTLAEQARLDPLTGLLNRRAGLAAIDDRLVAARHDDSSLALFVVDLDKFKSINDNYSHEMGDAALVRVAHVLTTLFADRGVICRLGGDEFEIAVSDIDMDAAVDLGEQLRAALHRSLTSAAPEHLPLFTASIGIACFPDDGDSAVELARHADAAMYAAKAAGANSVFTWRALQRDRAA